MIEYSEPEHERTNERWADNRVRIKSSGPNSQPDVMTTTTEKGGMTKAETVWMRDLTTLKFQLQDVERRWLASLRGDNVQSWCDFRTTARCVPLLQLWPTTSRQPSANRLKDRERGLLAELLTPKRRERRTLGLLLRLRNRRRRGLNAATTGWCETTSAEFPPGTSIRMTAWSSKNMKKVRNSKIKKTDRAHA
jgi:hypothetical protein